MYLFYNVEAERRPLNVIDKSKGNGTDEEATMPDFVMIMKGTTPSPLGNYPSKKCQ